MHESNYIIHEETLAIVQKWSALAEPYAKVYEEATIIPVAKSALHVIEENLSLNGQSFRGAKDGTQALVGKVYLPPITLNEQHKLYWFYTAAPGKEGCIWFALHGIKSYKEADDGGTNVVLINGKVIHVKVGAKAFDNKVKTTALLKTKREQSTVFIWRFGKGCHMCRGK